MVCNRRTVLFALVLAALPIAADAQGRRPGARGQQGARGHLSPSDIQDQFDAYAIVQAQHALRLTDAQYPQFVRRARELHTLRRRIRIERIRLIGDLNQQLRLDPADETKVAAATHALVAHDRTSFEAVQRAYVAIDEVLDVRQRARFRLLEDQLERKKLDMLFRARQAPRR